MLRFTLRMDIWQTHWWREYVTGNLTENPVNCRREYRSMLLRGTGGTLQKMAYWAVWMSMEKCKFTKGSALYSGEVEWWLHPQRLSVARLIVNGSGNTDFRLPWDLRTVTEVMRSECRGDFLYNRKLSFLLYKKPPAGCAFARRSRMSQATALSARMCPGTFYISYIR